MKSIVLLASFALGTAAVSAPLPFNAVSDAASTRFAVECAKLPSTAEMGAEIISNLQGNARLQNPTWQARFKALLGTKIKPDALVADAELDGMRLSRINAYDLEVISRLTSMRESANPFWESLYPVDQKVENGMVKIHRRCIASICEVRHREFPTDLSKFNEAPICSNALCAAKKIFGKKKGVYILWAYLKFGENMSPYSDINADPGGFDILTLQKMLVAFEATPTHLQETELKDNGFYRFEKGMTLALYGSDGGTIANAAGGVFDGIDTIKPNSRIYIFTHELGHRSSYLDRMNIDESEKWFEASGWRIGPKRTPVRVSKTGWISEYAQSNPKEDFAETYSLYRLDPKRLKKLSPSRYEFMKTYVFRQIEYTDDLCNGKIVVGSPTSPAQKPTGGSH